jgi:hypothetical protein
MWVTWPNQKGTTLSYLLIIRDTVQAEVQVDGVGNVKWRARALGSRFRKAQNAPEAMSLAEEPWRKNGSLPRLQE